MNENTTHPNSNCQTNCQPENDSQKAKDKHNEDMKHADHQKTKDDDSQKAKDKHNEEMKNADHQKMKDENKNKDSAEKKAEKAPGQ